MTGTDSTALAARVLLRLRIPAEREQARRLFHGRGRGFPGLEHVVVDWLPPVALVQLYSPEPAAEVAALARALMDALPGCSSVQVQERYRPEGPIEQILGEGIRRLTVREDDLRFHVHLDRGRHTGLFLDMRHGRRWVREHSRGRRVLNLFAYTCGFSVAAMAGGAASVLNVDMYSPSLSLGRDNHRLNGQDTASVRFEKLDVFKSFGRLARQGPFDLLICDPPAFQRGSVNVARDYPKILRRLDRFMAPGANLMLCLNALYLDRGFLLDAVAELAPNYELWEELTQPPEFVETEGRGLKLLIFKDSRRSA